MIHKMRGYSIEVVVLLLLLGCCVEGDNEEQGSIAMAPDKVIELTDSTFHAVIDEHEYVLVDFYAPWCGHCTRLSPQLDAAALLLTESKSNIILAKINADKYKKLASSYNVSAYPTLKLFIKGVPVDYDGPRRASSLVSHLQKLASPDITILTADHELENFMKNAGSAFPFFIGFGLQMSTIVGLGKQYKSKAWFVLVETFSEKTMQEYDFDKGPALIVSRQEFNEQDVFYGPFEGDDLAQFVHQNILPVVNPLNSDRLKLLNEDGRPIALAILKDQSSEISISFIKKLKAAAPANRGFVFAYVDAGQWPDFVESFNVKETDIAFVVWNGYSDYFVSVQPLDFTGDQADLNVSKLLKDYQDRNVVKHKLKGPSFMEFVSSHYKMGIIYTLVFVVATMVFLQNLGGETSERRQPEFDRSYQKDEKESLTLDSDASESRSGDAMNNIDT